jgi:hypothetical protein
MYVLADFDPMAHFGGQELVKILSIKRGTGTGHVTLRQLQSAIQSYCGRWMMMMMMMMVMTMMGEENKMKNN